eukprot:15107967-Alexandrium_andersonii.AAC.1
MAALRGVLAGNVMERVDLKLAEGGVGVEELIREVRRHAGVYRAEAETRRNDDDVDVGEIKTP